MCYSEFRDIMDAISALDADVLLIWHARSQMELLEYWKQRGYDKDIAPGVYDIHSPRVPPEEEMAEMLRGAAEALPRERLWVAPDCGLKTRHWDEIDPSLRNMVGAARQLREELVPAGA
jgi:5-methyltetrahydropteroyltriglutamate--homocysteine methyltransferase